MLLLLPCVGSLWHVVASRQHAHASLHKYWCNFCELAIQNTLHCSTPVNGLTIFLPLSFITFPRSYFVRILVDLWSSDHLDYNLLWSYKCHILRRHTVFHSIQPSVFFFSLSFSFSFFFKRKSGFTCEPSGNDLFSEKEQYGNNLLSVPSFLFEDLFLSSYDTYCFSLHLSPSSFNLWFWILSVIFRNSHAALFPHHTPTPLMLQPLINTGLTFWIMHTVLKMLFSNRSTCLW